MTVGEAERFARLQDRGMKDQSRLAKIESHSIERQVQDALRALADLVVDSGTSLERALETILARLR
ncbi:MAG: hypothetical protein A3I14_15410 [Candidatus Rokubacteria bacterium RIFCSPLOWO2_02_FULL_73_56]|nr:MAG: hypothetical protein A3I14_15410 [Candidatus Rokubacteria bacterium RIFCSPLOWO2_02_FULL_73_56]